MLCYVVLSLGLYWNVPAYLDQNPIKNPLFIITFSASWIHISHHLTLPTAPTCSSDVSSSCRASSTSSSEAPALRATCARCRAVASPAASSAIGMIDWWTLEDECFKVGGDLSVWNKRTLIILKGILKKRQTIKCLVDPKFLMDLFGKHLGWIYTAALQSGF